MFASVWKYLFREREREIRQLFSPNLLRKLRITISQKEQKPAWRFCKSMNFWNFTLPETNSIFAPKNAGISKFGSSPNFPHFQVRLLFVSGKTLTQKIPNPGPFFLDPGPISSSQVVVSPNGKGRPGHLCKYKKSQLPNRSSPVGSSGEKTSWETLSTDFLGPA